MNKNGNYIMLGGKKIPTNYCPNCGARLTKDEDK